MGEGKQENAKPFDPFEPLREMRDAYLDSMAKVMVETVNTEGYAQANGAILDSYLTASAPFREALEKWMVQALQQLSCLHGRKLRPWPSVSPIWKCGSMTSTPSWIRLQN